MGFIANELYFQGKGAFRKSCNFKIPVVSGDTPGNGFLTSF